MSGELNDWRLTGSGEVADVSGVIDTRDQRVNTVVRDCRSGSVGRLMVAF